MALVGQLIVASEIRQNFQQVLPEHLISEQLTEKYSVAYICVDQKLKVTRISDNLSYYGYPDIPIGHDINDHVDFMVGMDAKTDIDLAFVNSPAGVPIAVSLMPNKDELVVVITDVSQQAEQRRLLQQKANENELLLRQQEKLMAQLALASQSLEIKNKELEEASRLQTRFLSGVSHEFRTPLTSIIGHADLARADLQKHATSDLPECDNHLHALQRSSKHLLSLVENLLDHGKFDSNEIVLRPKAINLLEVFSDVEILLKPLSEIKHIEFTVDVDFAANVNVVIDASRLRQCLINLVGNAIKFTDIGSVNVNAVLTDDVLRVSIVDTGIGINDNDLEKVKRPFWQAEDTGKSGTGLGLTITEKIIELMGGELLLKSQFGEGTQVTFELMAPRVSLQEISEGHIQMLDNVSVLLVEDDADIAGLVLLMLTEKGLDVSHAENGVVALEIMAEQRFDLVLMDLNMPVMDGYQTVQALRERGDATPIVIMTASALDVDRSRAEELACDGYLVKPVDIEDILVMAMQLNPSE